MYSGLTGWWTNPMLCARFTAIPSRGWAGWPLLFPTWWRMFWCVRKKVARSPSNSRWCGDCCRADFLQQSFTLLAMTVVVAIMGGTMALVLLLFIPVVV